MAVKDGDFPEDNRDEFRPIDDLDELDFEEKTDEDHIKKSPLQETDPRFVSGPWVGFFLDDRMPGKHWMELHLDFVNGVLSGEGKDFVGEFLVNGTYNLEDGKCQFIKQYFNKHAIDYSGFNEGKGIWGTWILTWAGITNRGGFHIWPKQFGSSDPSSLKESKKIPNQVEAPQTPKKVTKTVYVS